MPLLTGTTLIDPELLEEEVEVSAATRKLRMLRTLVCGHRYERAARAGGACMIAGVDEVGRGALFGPVVAAAVILPEGLTHSRLARLKAVASRGSRAHGEDRRTQSYRHCN